MNVSAVGVVLFTVGHSTRSAEEFIALLREFRIEVLADIRRFPGSRKFPQFGREVLARAMAAAGLQYTWFENLGGRRHTPAGTSSPNAGLRNLSFRSYADHMATATFREAAAELIEVGTRSRTAMMCAERFYWRCHRRLVSDFLTAQGVGVEHIVESGKTVPHQLTPGAVIAEGAVLYPGVPSPTSPDRDET